MKQLHYTPLLAAFLCLASSCSAPFGYSIDLRGGWDPMGREDHLYFSAERVEGLDSDLNALVIPSGWQDRATREVSPGVLELEEPFVFQWIAGRENLQSVQRVVHQGWINPDGWVGDPEAWVRVQPRASALGVDKQPMSPLLDFQDYDEIHERLTIGQDAYVLVPHGRFLKHGFDVYAATGPPLIWVRLGVVQVESNEGPIAWTLGRSVGALAYGLDGAYLASTYVLGLAMTPWGGLLVFESTFLDALDEMTESPW